MKKYVAILSDGETHSSVSIGSEEEFDKAMKGTVSWGALFEIESGRLIVQVFNPPKPAGG